MVEEKKQPREIRDIFKELFFGSDSALEKYAKVRHVQYEMGLWRTYHCDIHGFAKAYFSARFVDGKKRLSQCTEAEIKEGLNRLDHAVKDGCHKRCVRLIKELNEALGEKGIEPLQDIETFLDLVTFDYTIMRDIYTGEPSCEPMYGFEIRIFHDAENRSWVRKKIDGLLSKNEMMPLNRICQMLKIEQTYSKAI